MRAEREGACNPGSATLLCQASALGAWPSLSPRTQGGAPALQAPWACGSTGANFSTDDPDARANQAGKNYQVIITNMFKDSQEKIEEVNRFVSKEIQSIRKK